ncbi:MAG: hypothetical protein OJF51_004372 [Nitrospira sp.]|nr:MAG: hypothetical protein OJF51_004372 [Nitrospira sp.]
MNECWSFARTGQQIVMRNRSMLHRVGQIILFRGNRPDAD